MHWRLPRPEYERGKGESNRRAMKALVTKGEEVGLLAYEDDAPVAWCAVAPREDFIRLQSSRILQPVDEQPVWSITCFFIAKAYRNRGLSVKLLRAACEHVKSMGGKILEGYPIAPKQGKMPDPFVWTGLASAFKKAGFKECARRSETRPIMRRILH
jgi:GNAT superfamily N-acetyltransferase